MLIFKNIKLIKVIKKTALNRERANKEGLMPLFCFSRMLFYAEQGA